MVWDIIIGALKILGSLGFFLYGMKVMSDGLQQAAGLKLRRLLGVMTTNRYTGVLTGFLITSLVQSSSATTVMTVSFVNAGLLSLVESAGVMMGANIGTTVTGWLVSLMGFKVKIASFALPLIALGFPFIFSKKENFKNWGKTVVGLALLFLGLEALKDSVPDLRQNEELISYLQTFSDPGIFSRLVFVLIGATLTIVMQSSSAAMTLTIALTLKGLPIEIGAAMILGENIGTTITAELAALVANSEAKRSARIHSIFNLIGVGWMIFLAPFFLEGIDMIFPAHDMDHPNAFTLAAFHTGFNFINVILLIGFVNILVSLASKTIKSKGDYETNDVIIPETLASLEGSRTEINKFSKLVYNSSHLFFRQLKEHDKNEVIALNKSIKADYFVSKEIEKRVSLYLIKALNSEVSEHYFQKMRSYFYIITDLERITDLLIHSSNEHVQKNAQNIYFTEYQLEQFDKLSVLVDNAFKQMIKNIDEEVVDIKASIFCEDKINDHVRDIRLAEIGHFNEVSSPVENSIIMRNIFDNYEKIGDHILNISRSLIEKGELVDDGY
ncbi:MAG: Na/Pi cotransporter family protein [Cyclobacteriaceae bacterium]|nr:Na/Pi cotransporter family protein [Cyclobacteriaceae bacterium]